ncbi:hypothetical protein BS47DRAFT_1394668 [Hydnum rufescens UP504]|uniref:Protein kinase domain-containing protein n=1 Tax=Hydnum rufescens UP504 TaxID=1448309 RepID=A0A9P6AUK7_9AGAM|nr:hypothetical protein BS47DRAFT_1394668 [Hydnum rufescens UP504]
MDWNTFINRALYTATCVGHVNIIPTDFGLSKYLDQSPTSTANRGSIRWLAPESLEKEIPRGT